MWSRTASRFEGTWYDWRRGLAIPASGYHDADPDTTADHVRLTPSEDTAHVTVRVVLGFPKVSETGGS